MESKNFGLTEAAFERMRQDLRANDTLFFEQVFVEQFKETMAYVKREYSAAHEDAYDATMDAIIDFRKRFVEGKLRYGNLRFLFTKMATQTYVRNKKKTSLPDHLEAINDEAVDETEPTEAMTYFKTAWEELGKGCKELLRNHYYGKMQLLEIAEQTAKAPAAVRKQKQRCIDKLRQTIGKNL